MTGKELQQRRKKIGITQRQLANLFEVEHNAVYRWESDVVPISRIIELAFEQLERTFSLNVGVDISTLELSSLPAIKLSIKSALPEISCIYFVIAAGEVIYIGQSINLRQRFLAHHRRSDFQSFPDCEVAWVECDPLQLLNTERLAIGRFSPALNGPNRMAAVPTEMITIRVPEPLLLEAKVVSRETGIPLSFVVRKGFEKWLADN